MRSNISGSVPLAIRIVAFPNEISILADVSATPDCSFKAGGTTTTGSCCSSDLEERFRRTTSWAADGVGASLEIDFGIS